MKNWIVFLVVLCFTAVGCSQDQTQRIEQLEKENAELKAQLAPPPSTLDAYFPPNTEEPVFLMRMLGMAMPLTGMMVDFLQNDMENIAKDFEAFKTQFQEVSHLVPEWTGNFPMEPVEALGQALQSRDQGKIMAAADKLLNVCNNCHLANMVKVQQRYNWQNITEMTITDPLSKQEVPFAEFKHMMDTSFTGIVHDLQQGQLENSRNNLQGFKARFAAFSDICGECHGTDERNYYIDDNIGNMISSLEAALNSSPINGQDIQKIFMGIGMESCFKCHLTHGPAAMTQMRWSK